MFAVYLPGRTGANPKHLADVGLGELLAPGDDAPMFTDLSQGPDGAHGMAVHWDAALPPAIDWQPAARRKEPRAEVLFWFGRTPDVALGPAHFARKRQLRGTPVTLADGNAWLVPIARQVPQTLGMRADGAWEGETLPQYVPFFDACWKFWETMTAPEDTVISWVDACAFIAMALSINYRVNADVIGWLRLVRTDRLFDVHMAAIESELLSEALQQKKSDPPGSAGGSPSTAAGAPA